MPTIHFKGVVLPETWQITVNPEPSIKWQPTDTSQAPIEFTEHVASSQIDVKCEVSEFQAANYSEAYWHAVALANAAVDLVAFGMGIALTVYFHTFIGPSGVGGPIIHRREYGDICTSFPINSLHAEGNAEFDKIYKILIEDPWLFIAMNDLILAVGQPQQSVVNCARVIDSIRKLLDKSRTDQTISSWENMHTELNCTRPYLEFISQWSTNPRHGTRGYIEPAITV
jgi:hypothetical protein